MSTHSARLERWLGTAQVEEFSRNMRGWYGPPIALAGVPGEVYACGDGDFTGRINGGFEATLQCFMREAARRMRRTVQSRATFGAGFSTLTDLLVSAKNGRRQTIPFGRDFGSFLVAGCVQGGWRASFRYPAPGNVGAAAPGGTVYTTASAGAMPFNAARAGEQTHFAGGQVFIGTGSQALGSILLHDRLFSVAKTMNSTATEAVTGVPTRYTSTTPTAADYAGGNFLFMECTTTLPATAHNWTVCTYTDQDGNAGATLPSVTGNVSCADKRLDTPVYAWFAPLAAGDTGIKALTQMQCSALVATGAIEFTIAHPIAWFPVELLGFSMATDAIRSAFNMVRIFDGAALSTLYLSDATSGNPNTRGIFDVVQG